MPARALLVPTSTAATSRSIAKTFPRRQEPFLKQALPKTSLAIHQQVYPPSTATIAPVIISTRFNPSIRVPSISGRSISSWMARSLVAVGGGLPASDVVLRASMRAGGEARQCAIDPVNRRARHRRPLGDPERS
jgi:hypothetical protein